jgi:hypothetical protein
VHAGLVPEHLHESGRLGALFALAAGAAALSAAALRRWPGSPLPPLAAAGTLLGLIAAYAISRTTGLTPLEAHTESLDPLGVATKLVEVVGMAAAVCLLTVPAASQERPRGHPIEGGRIR